MKNYNIKESNRADKMLYFLTEEILKQARKLKFNDVTNRMPGVQNNIFLLD